MAVKTKAAAILIGAVVLMGAGVAMASNAKTKKKARKGVSDLVNEIKDVPDIIKAVDKDDEPATDKDDDDDEDIEIEVVAPGKDGTPEGGGSITIPDKDAEKIADGVKTSTKIPANVAPGIPIDREAKTLPITPADKKLATLAKKDGIPVSDAAAEVVAEITKGQPASPLGIAETTKEMDPDKSVSLAREMLARETLPDWKNDLKAEIEAWQAKVKILKPDGMFGVKSAARMAEEVGFLPMIRFWPKGVKSKVQGEKMYDDALRVVIDTKLKKELPDSKAQIEALHASMDREIAVSFGNTNPPPQDTLNFVQEATEEIADNAQAKGEKDIKNV